MGSRSIPESIKISQIFNIWCYMTVWSLSCMLSCRILIPLSMKDFNWHQRESCPTLLLLPAISTDLQLFSVYFIQLEQPVWYHILFIQYTANFHPWSSIHPLNKKFYFKSIFFDHLCKASLWGMYAVRANLHWKGDLRIISF